MFIVNGFFKVYALVLNFFFFSQPVNLQMEFELRDLEKGEVESIIEKESARGYFSVRADRMNAMKKIFEQREPISTIKIKKTTKRRIPGRTVFDCDRDKLIENFSSVDIGELVAYRDDDLQKIVYAKVCASEDYRPKGKRKKIVLYDLIVGYDGDEKIYKKRVLPGNFYKFPKELDI